MGINAIRRLLLAVALLAAGCAEDLMPDDEPDTRDAGTTGDAGIATIVTVEGGDTYTTTVDAADYESWQYFDLDTRTQADEGDDAWDLAFQRFKIKTNGGISGDGEVEVSALTERELDGVQSPATDGYVQDAEDSDDDDDDDEDLAFLFPERWYDYDPSDHTLSPRDTVYVVRSTEGRHFKLQITGYYDAAGSAGRIEFVWAALAP